MLAMRPALCSIAPNDIAAHIATCDARRHPAQAAMLLRSWMSDHG
jgi:hypothetical protein